MKREEVEKIRNLLHKIGLPTSVKYDGKAVIQAARKDKKAVSGKIYYALPSSIGKMHMQDGKYAIHVDDKIVLKALEMCR